MKNIVNIKNFELFKEKAIPLISRIEFLGNIYDNENDIIYYSREAYLIKESIKFEYKKQ